LNVPGWLFASAMNSLTVRAGTEGLITTMW